MLQDKRKPYLAQLKPYKNFDYANRFIKVDNLHAYNSFDKAIVHIYTYSLLTVFFNQCVSLSRMCRCHVPFVAQVAHMVMWPYLSMK